MSRIISSPNTGNFPPLVGLRTAGNYVKGRVNASGQTTAGNPFVTLSLIDLEGSTSVSESKGVYKEVSVEVGDNVQLVGSSKQLRGILPQLQIGDVVTITFEGKKKLPGGKSLNQFKAEVE